MNKFWMELVWRPGCREGVVGDGNGVQSVKLAELMVGEVLLLRTQQAIYHVLYLGHGAARLSSTLGAYVHPRAVNLLGSHGESGLLMDVLAPGSSLAFQHANKKGVRFTPLIHTIDRLQPKPPSAPANDHPAS